MRRMTTRASHVWPAGIWLARKACLRAARGLKAGPERGLRCSAALTLRAQAAGCEPPTPLLFAAALLDIDEHFRSQGAARRCVGKTMAKGRAGRACNSRPRPLGPHVALSLWGCVGFWQAGVVAERGDRREPGGPSKRESASWSCKARRWRGDRNCRRERWLALRRRRVAGDEGGVDKTWSCWSGAGRMPAVAKEPASGVRPGRPDAAEREAGVDFWHIRAKVGRSQDKSGLT